MRKIYAAVCMLLSFYSTKAQVVIADSNFSYLLSISSSSNTIAKNLNNVYFKIDSNGDGIIQHSEALQVSYIDVANHGSRPIATLQGIEAFTNLRTLYVHRNPLNTIDVSALTKLEDLNCALTQISTLDLTNLTLLKNLNCNDNTITELNISHMTDLEILECGGNLLTNLNLSGLIKLKTVGCNNNQLPELNLAGLSDLEMLICSNNRLASLDLTGLNLQILYCDNNPITTLDLSTQTNLMKLGCKYTGLTTLNVSNLPQLTYISCDWNSLTSIYMKGTAFNSDTTGHTFTFQGNPYLEYVCSNENQLPYIRQKITDYRYTCVETNTYCEANEPVVTIPDTAFKTALINSGCATNQIAWNAENEPITVDANNNGKIETSEALRVVTLNVNNLAIASLEGINAFTNLKSLNCSNNQLETVDLNGLSQLTYFNCDSNLLSVLDASMLPDLEILHCRYNSMTTLNVIGLNHLKTLVCSINGLGNMVFPPLPSLTFLECDNNEMTELHTENLTSLISLHARDNQLTRFDALGLPALKDLFLGNNQLTTLNVSGHEQLVGLGCEFNNLSILDLSGLTELQYIYLNDNHLTELNVSDSSLLLNISCSNNPITALDLSQHENLTNVFIDSTRIATIDLNKATMLESLYGFDNTALETVYIKNGAVEMVALNGCSQLRYICADDIQIGWLTTFITSEGLSQCTVNSYCSFTPGGENFIVNGNARFDLDQNGCGTSDLNMRNLKLSVTDGFSVGTFISDQSGLYTLAVTAGEHVITPILEKPEYFTITPATVTAVFPETASPFQQDFCITANNSHPDLDIVIIPINLGRPGFDANYKLIYRNKGTQTLSGNISFNYDDAVSDFISANPVVSQLLPNAIHWVFSGLQPFESREINLTLNLNAPTETPALNANDILEFTTAIATTIADETPLDNTNTLSQMLFNSFDPNDKICLEGSLIAADHIGKDVHYMIRFENTGTFAAENIVVKDVIDTNKFDISSLIAIGGSHPFVTKISDGNKVEFIFENINLPFADNENDGYVVFKIRTLPNLTSDDTFSNTAEIYFDYNFPIITNTATTAFGVLSAKDFGTADLFKIYPNPVKSVLNIHSKQYSQINNISIYNGIGQLLKVIPNAQHVKTVDVSDLSSGNYFIKIASETATATLKFLKE